MPAEECHSLNTNLMTSPPRQTRGFTEILLGKTGRTRQINDLPGGAQCKEMARRSRLYRRNAWRQRVVKQTAKT